MSGIKNPELRKSVLEAVASQRKFYFDAAQQIRLNAAIVDASLEKLGDLALDWFGTSILFIRVIGETKAEFSAMVEKVALALSEPPDVKIEPNTFSGKSSYIAEFPASRVHVYLSSPNDCTLIETEEPQPPRKVLTPHPTCVAALSALEDVV